MPLQPPIHVVDSHWLEAPVGIVQATLHEDRSVTVENVPSYRYRSQVTVDVPGLQYPGRVTGDIAWGGNWFFLVADPPCALTLENRAQLVAAATAIRTALGESGITGAGGACIDHIEFFSAPHDAANSSRNFVLCPGASFDRSPCGTGTSAKMACLYEEGKLAAGTPWRQEGILDTVFEGMVLADPAVGSPVVCAAHQVGAGAEGRRFGARAGSKAGVAGRGACEGEGYLREGQSDTPPYRRATDRGVRRRVRNLR